MGAAALLPLPFKGDRTMPAEMDACARAMKGKAENEFAL
jgi:hypothetical protein